MTDETFTHRTLPHLGKRVHRLGLACNGGIDARGFERAMERGVGYVFWTRMRTGHLKEPLRAALKKNRDRMVIATGPTIGFFGGSVTRAAERVLKELAIDCIDVLQLFWLGKGSAWTDATTRALLDLKAAGKVRAIGISIHDRARAGRLVQDSPLDLFMIRYNAAHPGAERDIFPHVPADRPAFVAYTATSWRKLLKRPRGWDGPVMTAGDCYRFCLSSPYVDVTLSAPASEAELDANLDAVEKGALTKDEAAWMRAFGAKVHGGGHAAAPPSDLGPPKG